MEIVELAAMMAADGKNPERKISWHYYMVNVNNPIIAALRREFCKSRNISMLYPMSDQERFEFELCLFQPSVRNKIVSILEESEQIEKIERKDATAQKVET